jgi:hypothetical protein
MRVSALNVKNYDDSVTNAYNQGIECAFIVLAIRPRLFITLKKDSHGWLRALQVNLCRLDARVLNC